MEQVKENVFDVMYEPLAGSSLTNLLRLTSQNRFGISPRYIPRYGYAVLMSSILSPFRLKERLIEHKHIKKISIDRDPVFIIGHWRSGTTYLHNVLSLDDSFGCCSTFHATLPHVFLQSEKLLKPLLSASIPTKRPMDDVAMGPDLPQEEEYAIANIIPDGYYNGWCFPKNMNRYMNHVIIDTLPVEFQNEWINTYDFFVKKLTYYHNGKQLLLKNPAHTARLKTLKEMYPNAKFVHIHRNPYEVFYSMNKFMRIVLPRYCVQRPPSQQKMKASILHMYKHMYQTYLQQKKVLSKKDIIEISYEHFIKDTLKEIQHIYDYFDILMSKELENKFKKYVESQKEFNQSTYTMSESLKDEIWQEWSFAFDAFQYAR